MNKRQIRKEQRKDKRKDRRVDRRRFRLMIRSHTQEKEPWPPRVIYKNVHDMWT